MLPLTKFTIGLQSEIIRSFTAAEVASFARLSGDVNPIHLDEEFAENTQFGRRIVHGAFLTSIFSTIFANQLPGVGCIYLKSENKFLKPVYLNEDVLFKVEVIDILLDKKRIKFQTSAHCKDQLVIIGVAELYLPD